MAIKVARISDYLNKTQRGLQGVKRWQQGFARLKRGLARQGVLVRLSELSEA